MVQAVKAEMLKNRWVTAKDLEEKLVGVCSRDSIRVILQNELNYRKVFAKQLSEAHKRQRVECAEEDVRSFEEERDDFLHTIDEACAHLYTFETKQQLK